MIETCEDHLKQCEQDQEQWNHEYGAWMEEVQYWQGCECKVVAVLYELESALPNHRIQLNRFHDMLRNYKRTLSDHRCSASHARTDAIDENCQTELEDLQKFGISRCQNCEPQCFQAVMEIHRQATGHHEKMADAHSSLKTEYESAMGQMQRLADRLLTGLNR